MEETKNNMLDEIITDLSDNYKTTDEELLTTLLDETITNALFISNRVATESNIILLKGEIKKCVKTMYLQRGTEDVSSSSESGRNSTFINSYETLRNDIVNSGKRVVF